MSDTVTLGVVMPRSGGVTELVGVGSASWVASLSHTPCRNRLNRGGEEYDVVLVPPIRFGGIYAALQILPMSVTAP